MADEFCKLRWDLSFALIRKQEARNMHITVAAGKRATLYLYDDTRDMFTAEFKNDHENDVLVKETLRGMKWYDPVAKRSYFNRMNIKQLVMCFLLENWKFTSRYTCI